MHKDAEKRRRGLSVLSIIIIVVMCCTSHWSSQVKDHLPHGLGESLFLYGGRHNYFFFLPVDYLVKVG
jgi:hypothetical protein